MNIPSDKQKRFILISSDIVDFSGTYFGAFEAACRRLEYGFWPIYPGTRNRTQFSRGDACLIYIAGQGLNAQCIVWETKIVEIMRFRARSFDKDKLVVEQYPDQVIQLEDVRKLSPIFNVKRSLSKLSFIPKNRKRWGAAFQGGCRQVNQSDCNKILGIN